MQVDAGARPGKDAPVSYAVHEAGLVETSLANQTAAAKFVNTALSAKGMFEAPNPETADMDVTYSYEIKQQRRVREWDESIYQIKRGGGDHVGGSVGEGPLGKPIYIDPPAELDVEQVHHTADEIVYLKELHLVATERKPATTDTPARVWDISIGYEDADPNLEKSMPLLAAAGCDHIGTNTNGPIIIRLRDKDEVVAFIKRGL